jgi:hypothetical protein
MTKILYLEKMGMDFPQGEPIRKLSNLKNYRLRFKDVVLKDEFIKTLRSNAIPVISGDLISGRDYSKGFNDKTKLFLDIEYQTEEGNFYRPLVVEDYINNNNYEYTKEDVLKAINFISKDKYTKIVILEKEGK